MVSGRDFPNPSIRVPILPGLPGLPGLAGKARVR